MRGIMTMAMVGLFVGVPVVAGFGLWLSYHLCRAVYFYMGGTL